MSIFNKTSLTSVFKRINFPISEKDFLSEINKEYFKKITSINFNSVNPKVLTEFFYSHYYYSKKYFSKSLISSFSVIEFLLREEYSKHAVNAHEAKIVELLKWSKNRNLISAKYFNYLEGIRHVRNKIVHDLKDCMPEETSLSLVLSTEILCNFSKK